jgi:hypothetical protein
LPEQHPAAQLVGVQPPQAPFTQVFCWLPAWQAVPEQHPAQVTPSHTQVPATQCCPDAHAALEPQRQAPAPEQPSAVSELHATQAPPLAPQAPNDRGVHVVPEQHPAAQEVAVQAQAPLVQTWPEAHWALPPQVQAPAAEQPSALEASQAVQAAPAKPQLANPRIWHEPPEQQPAGHDVASHEHVPLPQCCPVGQGWPLPHWQVPLGQPSARMASQGAQAAPAAAQALALRTVHDSPEQQPAAQFDESHPLHTPTLHGPDVQPWQRPPPVPHAVSAPPGRQVVPEQQPPQETASQTHALPKQR